MPAGARTRSVKAKPRALQRLLPGLDSGPEIPEKLYFKIGEVAELAGVQPYILRYWETQFPTLRPTKSPRGQRLYRRNDVMAVFRIKELLYQKRFTIAGARRHMAVEQGPFPPTVSDAIRLVKEELKHIASLLRAQSP
ncbi:MerR family transcriptional regulator [Candidatus Methylomirabilis sp.]|uniref:MerR family transcriptional regulator n=1 Tax=Candidatus Methylomirabilis tolerans TaxID=3123416 RepID=A0AAJ1AHF8_9BACT|nr:MerR family transcriptional regulator [Candidatus Methylomirabilis sp.]